MITSSVNRVIYKGNGVATEFAYPFKIFNRTDIKVLLVDKDGNRSILTSDYYVDMEAMKVYYPGYAPGAEEPEGDRPDILQEGETLVVYREVPITQIDRLPENYPFNVIEKMTDKNTVVSQQINDRLSRAIVVGEETGIDFDGTVAIVPGKTFAVNEDGTGFVLATNPDIVAAQITAALGVTETNVNTALMATTEYVDNKVETTEQNINASLTSTENRINSALSTTETNVNRAIASNTEYVNQKTQITENNVAAALAATEGSVAAELNETKQTINQKVEQVQGLVDSLGGLTIEALEAVRDECLEKAGDAQTAADRALTAASELQGNVAQIETNTEDIANIYSVKADKATTIAGYGITNAYTKGEITNLLSNKADQSSTYTKTEVNASLANKADKSNTYTKTEVTTFLSGKLDKAQGVGNEGKILQVASNGELTLVDMPQTGGGIDVGSIIAYAGNGDIPNGFLLCNGASVGVDTYPALFEVIGYTYGGSGDYFNLPNLNDNRFIEGSSVAGQYKDAGLPNIEGEFGGLWVAANSLSMNGAFIGTLNSKSRSQGSTGDGAYDFNFDASLSNPIYGASDTVQPKSITVIWIIKAFAGASADSTDLEITKVANDLVGVAGRTEGIQDYIVDSGKSSDGTMWYRKWKSGWLEMGGYGLISVSGNIVVNFVKEYNDTTYHCNVKFNGANTVVNDGGTATKNTVKNYTPILYNKLINQVTFPTSTEVGIKGYTWYACGQGGND